MTRKMLSAILVFGLVVIMFGLIVPQASEPKAGECTVLGRVYHSLDGAAEIYNETGNWTCDKITAYRLANVTDIAINDGAHDDGYHLEDYDKFSFNAALEWSSWNDGERGICVGETYEASTKGNYVFITQFTISVDSFGLSINNCIDTEWELIPTPIIYLKNEDWINLSIPKFTNPRIFASDGSTPNADNTIGFAVYRDGICLGGTTIANATHYFFNDTAVADTQSYTAQNYSIRPIARGGYCVAAIAPLPELSATIVSPIVATRWTGNETQEIVYMIAGGVAPHTVYLSYSTDDGLPDTFSSIDVTSVAFGGTHTYLWKSPLFAGDADFTKINVTVLDSLGRSCSALSRRFVIDCTPPTITIKQPIPDKTNVSIYEDIIIEFSEPVDKPTATFSATPLVTLTPNWTDSTEVILSHPPFERSKEYNFSIEVKDLSLPGNTNSTTWRITTTSRISLSLHFPYSDVRLTGNVTQEIKYEVGGGIDPYNVTIQFWDGTSWGDVPELNINLTGVFADTYIGSWKPPALNIDDAKLELKAEDAQPDIFECEYIFNIDSTLPTIVTYSGSTGVIRTTEHIRVQFSERMNKTSVEQSFNLKISATDTIVNWTASWEDGDKTIIFIPTQTLASNTSYTATISNAAKDTSTPGNPLTAKTWTFTAVEGLGVISASVNFIPLVPQKGDKITISATVSNTGSQAFGYSGTIIIKLYQRKDAAWNLVKTESISNMLANGTPVTKSFEVTPEDIGIYEYMIEVYSMSPQDIVDGESGKTAVQILSISVTEKKEIGVGPYALIALMVLLVIVIGFLVIASYKKESERKAKTEEEEEEKKEE